MDEIKLVSALRPADPAEAAELRQRARTRVVTAFTANASDRPAWKSRRTLTFASAAVAVAASAAIVAPAVLPQGSAGTFVTAAWAVQRSSDGTITITLNRTLTHQAELQADLRKDGVKAYVRSLAHCGIWAPRGGREKETRSDWKALLFPAPGNHDANFGGIIIHPAKIPANKAVFLAGASFQSGLGIQLFLMPANGRPVCTHRGPLVRSAPISKPRQVGPSTAAPAPASPSPSARASR
jgi:hypothetical protein